MDRPTIFLSSTIYDFRDLRSAIKDHLEQRGCKVLASEFNDFTKPLDKHSYEACLDAIKQADLFILLIGTRTGGWADAANKISITRAEYRHAYELAKAGDIRLLTFVRDDVWNHRQSVKELRRALRQQTELSAEAHDKLANFSTNFMSDPKVIIDFIDEVSRNKETAAAVSGEGELPVANWIHPFKSFSDIRDAIDPLILFGMSAQVAAGRKALQSQLLAMIQGLLAKTTKSFVYAPAKLREIIAGLGLRAETLTEMVRVESGTWTTLLLMCMYASAARADPAPLVAALSSDLLLHYDPKTGKFESSPEYDMLAEIVRQANAFEKSTASMQDLLKFGKRVDSSEARSVPTHILVEHLHRLLRWTDLLGSARALAAALEGHILERPQSLPLTPFVDQEEGVAKDIVTLDDARRFVGLPISS